MKKIISIVFVLLLLAGLVGCSSRYTYTHNHDFSTEIVAPTCSKEGYTKYTCKTCHFKTWGDYVSAVQNGGHTYNNCVCIECGDFLIDEAVDSDSLLYRKGSDGDGNEFYVVTGVTEETEYVKIPSTHDGVAVTQIDDKAFYNNLTLKHVVIPDSVVSIGEAVFKWCFNLMSVSIPDSVVSIGKDAFWDCQNLKSISLPRLTTINDFTLIGCESLVDIEIPDGVTEIGIHAISDCYSLTSITIPVSVTYIYHAALWRCRSLQNIYYKGTMQQWNAITKEVGMYWNTNNDASWNAYTGEYIVYCSDGQIENN